MVSHSLNSSGTHRICNWWIAYTFDNPLRRLIHNPPKVLGSYVKAGMTVMDLGCGMGHFSIGMARLVGNTGRVIAVDLQQKMLDVMERRVRRAGLADRILPHRCQAEDIGIMEPVDFILAFWMVHETPDPAAFFKETAAILKPSAKLLYAEPAFHVPEKRYREILTAAGKSGLKISRNLSIRFSRAALLEKMV